MYIHTYTSTTHSSKHAPVCGTDHHDLSATVQAVHECEECGHDGAVDLVLATGADRSEAVDLVEEDDRRSHLVSLENRHETLQRY